MICFTLSSPVCVHSVSHVQLHVYVSLIGKGVGAGVIRDLDNVLIGEGFSGIRNRRVTLNVCGIWSLKMF